MKALRPIFYATAIPLLYGVFLFLINLQVYNQWVPFMALVAVTGMFAFYFVTLRLGLLAMLNSRQTAKVLGALGVFIIVFTVYDTSYWFIYELFPSWNLFIYKPKVEFSHAQFQANITSMFSTTALISLISVARTWFERYRRANNARLITQDQTGEDMYFRAGLQQTYPRFKEEESTWVLGEPVATEPQVITADYLAKLLEREVFREAIEDTLTHLDKKLDCPDVGIIELPSAEYSRLNILVNCETLLHAEILDKTMTLHSINERKCARITMGKLEAMLPESYFIRVHRSHMIHVRYVKAYGQGCVKLHYLERSIPVAEQYQEALETAVRFWNWSAG